MSEGEISIVRFDTLGDGALRWRWGMRTGEFAWGRILGRWSIRNSRKACQAPPTFSTRCGKGLRDHFGAWLSRYRVRYHIQGLGLHSYTNRRPCDDEAHAYLVSLSLGFLYSGLCVLLFLSSRRSLFDVMCMDLSLPL